MDLKFGDSTLESVYKVAKENGYKVLATLPTSENGKILWLYITDGVNIGYCDTDYFGHLKFSTVNKPDKSVGTGGVVEHENILDGIKKSMGFAPKWYPSTDLQKIKKYKDADEFINRIPVFAKYNYI